MWRRLSPLVPAVIAGAAVAATSAGGAPHAAQHKREPAVTASGTLRLPSLQRCVKGDSVRVGLVPPPGVTFAALSVRLGSDEILQLAGLAGPGSVKVMLPFGRARVNVSGTTSGGQFLQATQTYHRCVKRAPRKPVSTPKPVRNPRPRPTPYEPSLQGGGVD